MSTKRPDDLSEDSPDEVGGTCPSCSEPGARASSEDPPDEVAAGVSDTSPADAPAAQPHDALFRQIFGDPAHAAAVLKSILPPRVAAHIDWNTPFEPTHASMVGEGSEQRHGDLLFKVKLIDGRGAFVWVLFEHQSTVHRWMALRLSRMVQGFLDDWHRRNSGSRYLPAVLPVVLHHGPRPWRAPTSLLELTDLGLVIAIRYTERVNPHLDRDTLIRHLAPLVGPGLEHTMLTFEQLLRNEEFQKGLDKGIEKGIKKGIEKGQRELLLRLLTERFGSLPAAITQRVARASLQDLERWGGRILKAASLDDVFASS